MYEPYIFGVIMVTSKNTIRYEGKAESIPWASIYFSHGFLCVFKSNLMIISLPDARRIERNFDI